jgi:hypothetical protein
MSEQITALSERQCEHADVRYSASEKGAVACYDCGRLFGHLRTDGLFVAFNSVPAGMSANLGILPGGYFDRLLKAPNVAEGDSPSNNPGSSFGV